MNLVPVNKLKKDDPLYQYSNPKNGSTNSI